MPTTITGEMFSITVDGPRAEIRIWRRPDLDSETGAKNAARIAEEAVLLPGRGVRAIVLDVRDAPSVAGPKSIASMGAMMAAWAAARLRIDDPHRARRRTQDAAVHARDNRERAA